MNGRTEEEYDDEYLEWVQQEEFNPFEIEDRMSGPDADPYDFLEYYDAREEWSKFVGECIDQAFVHKIDKSGRYAIWPHYPFSDGKHRFHYHLHPTHVEWFERAFPGRGLDDRPWHLLDYQLRSQTSEQNTDPTATKLFEQLRHWPRLPKLERLAGSRPRFGPIRRLP